MGIGRGFGVGCFVRFGVYVRGRKEGGVVSESGRGGIKPNQIKSILQKFISVCVFDARD